MSNESIKRRMVEDRRLEILRVLAAMNNQQANTRQIQIALHVLLKFLYEEHEIVADLKFMELHQLVALEQLGGEHLDIYMARLRPRGAAVVSADVTVGGVSSAQR